MQYSRLLILLILVLFSSNSFADKKIKIGVTWGYTASGFFSPEVVELVVKKVIPKSPAEKAGLEVGHKVTSIQGCEIPGCSASAAKGFLNTPIGSVLHLIVETSDGSKKEINIEVGKA